MKLGNAIVNGLGAVKFVADVKSSPRTTMTFCKSEQSGADEAGSGRLAMFMSLVAMVKATSLTRCET